LRLPLYLLCVSLFATAVHAAGPGDRILGGCRITSTNPTATSTVSDADCKWPGGAQLQMQCTGAVYLAGGGVTATAEHDLIGVGDPYPVTTYSRDEAFSILCVSGACTCEFKMARK
jgi:hypothetical protein